MVKSSTSLIEKWCASKESGGLGIINLWDFNTAYFLNDSENCLTTRLVNGQHSSLTMVPYHGMVGPVH